MLDRVPTVLAGLLLGSVFYLGLNYWAADFRPEDAALGPFTVSRDACFAGERVVFRDGEQLDLAARVFRGESDAGRQVALWMGASHLYAINHYHPGEENAVFHANRLGAARGARLRYLGLGLPNGNMNEFLALYLYFRSQGLVPQWLIVGALFDDLREPGVRPKVRAIIPELSAQEIAWMGTGAANLCTLRVTTPHSEPIDRSAVAGTPQEYLEQGLVDWLEAHCRMFADRHRLRAFIEWKVRALVFQVGEGLRRAGNPTRRAPAVPAELHGWNMEALHTLIRVARADSVQVLLYRPPHPQLAGPFYHDRRRYDRFFSHLRQLAAGDAGLHVLDLETLVPLAQWRFGTYTDMWHFAEPGHVALATAVDQFLTRHQEAWGDAVQ